MLSSSMINMQFVMLDAMYIARINRSVNSVVSKCTQSRYVDPTEVTAESKGEHTIHEVSLLPPKRAAKRKPVDPMGKYEMRYHARATIWMIADIRVSRVLWS
jgi:hypothetical protein